MFAHTLQPGAVPQINIRIGNDLDCSTHTTPLCNTTRRPAAQSKSKRVGCRSASRHFAGGCSA
jgi:hypothetical protein